MARFLLDTQILIWALTDRKRISTKAMDILLDSSNELLVSQISLYEITIKQSVGKLDDFSASTDEIIAQIQNDDFRLFLIQNHHIANYSKIPLIGDHRDPFDRLLLATALSEQIPIISADEKFQYYTNLITVIW